MTKMAIIWCLIFLSISGVHSQLDNSGFISIDCGYPDNSTYVDSTTGITYTSDNPFINTGTNYDIPAEYRAPSLSKLHLSVRSFESGSRNCYSLRSLAKGSKYLIRATFLYGNYDRLNTLVAFDLYIGVNFWKTVNISDAAATYIHEVITVALDDYVHVCLVNTGMGTPIISGLELRPIKFGLYPAVNSNQSIALYNRVNAGPTDNNVVVRYPQDPYDRIWKPGSNEPFWTEISTNSTVQNQEEDFFEVPSAVMQTAVTPVNSSEIKFFWTPKPQDKNPGFVAAMHFAEFQFLGKKDVREFDIFLNDWKWNKEPLSAPYLYSGFVYSLNPFARYPQYNFSIIATKNSTLPPILNALEVFTVLDTTGVTTHRGDVSGMMAIKAWYGLKRNWMGDPCSPKAFAWDGLTCSLAISGPPRITALNLSSSGLTGGITTSFANLTSLQYLDLSNNSLTGTIPDELSQLPSIKFLDLTGNQLNGSVPGSLLKRSQDGSLTLRIGDNKDLCTNENSCVLAEKKKSSITLIVVIALVVVVVLFLAVLLIVCIRRRGLSRFITVRPDLWNPYKKASDHGGSLLQLENRQFSYKELVAITSNFAREIGKGGFGKVYDGFLENGTQVAVKMRSHTSSQGVKEFLAEAQHLARVHHKNLVAMIGYCKDGDYLGLVYEYMSEGTLQDHLTGKSSSGRPLTWRQRLRITHESAQGLEYLHRGCKPPLIHRDVKTNNILLTANLEAKIADFGLSKAFDSDKTHVSTAVVGTPGYVDPGYYTTFQLSEKSDVYSFGVILLEIITAKPPILSGTEPIHIIHWVHQRLERGIIESVIDPRMQDEYNVNSVWKVADLALKCTVQSPNERPTMTDVVEQLKECLELESADERTHNMQSRRSSTNDNLYSEVSNISRSSASIEMEHVSMRSVATDGPTAR